MQCSYCARQTARTRARKGGQASTNLRTVLRSGRAEYASELFIEFLCKVFLIFGELVIDDLPSDDLLFVFRRLHVHPCPFKARALVEFGNELLDDYVGRLYTFTRHQQLSTDIKEPRPPVGIRSSSNLIDVGSVKTYSK